MPASYIYVSYMYARQEEGMFDALDELAAGFVEKGLGAEEWRRFVGGKEEL